MTRGGQRGFTLIELMIALVVSSLLVGMILAIFNRMSISYRGQQQIAGVQQVLAAARATIETDAKQAGLEMPQGFKLGSETVATMTHSPVLWTDNLGGAGPDTVAFYYADPTLQAKAFTASSSSVITFDPALGGNPGFVAGQLIALANVDPAGFPAVYPTDPTIAKIDTCVTKVLAASSTQLTISTVAPWGINCAVTPNSTMVYTFVAHAYRIDTSNDPTITSGAMFPSARGTLQMSATGGLLPAGEVWKDLAYGFTDIQVAIRFYDADVIDQDGDGDATRDWYSGPIGAGMTSPINPATPIRMSISLVARTDRDIEGISTSVTPSLNGSTILPAAMPVDYNPLGNHASVALPAQAPWSADPLLKGARVYRFVTFQVDLRNIGVGR